MREVLIGDGLAAGVLVEKASSKVKSSYRIGAYLPGPFV